MRGRSTQKSNGSREEAVPESVGKCPQTFVSFCRWKNVKENVSGVRGVLDYAVCVSEAARSVNSVNRWEADLNDGQGFVHNI